MIKKFAYGAVAAAALTFAPLAASAATFDVLAHSTQGIGNQADVFGAGFDAYTNGGAAWSVDPEWLAPGVANYSQSPFNNTVLSGTQDYFSVGGPAHAQGGAASPVTLTFGKVQSAFRMLWGSIDTYNSITFSNGVDADYTVSGTDIANAIGGLTESGGNYEHVALVVFSDFGENGFNSVTFTSDNAAFEFALAPVPLPAAGFLLMGALGGLAVIRRRRKDA